MILNNTKYEILTPEGFMPFDALNVIEKPKYLHITLSNGKTIDCSDCHNFIVNGKNKIAKGLKPKDKITSKISIVSIKLVEKNITLYDPINVGLNHLYYSDSGILNHNCSFEGSSYTLVDGTKLAQIPLSLSIYEKDGLEVFNKPEAGKSYTITVDVSRGRHHDYSAFSVVDVTQMPYKVVATYKNNEISTLEFPHLIYNTAREYNNAFILVEVNDLGEEVSNILWYEYEYENLYFTSGGTLSQGRGYPGVRTTTKVKGLGCSVLKELVEKDQLELQSHKIVQELGLFVMHRKSYASSDTNVNDDLCTTLWLFAWLTKQDIFQQITNNNLREILTQKKQDYIDSTMTPFGFYEDNKPKDEISSRTLPSKENPYYLSEDQIELLNF